MVWTHDNTNMSKEHPVFPFNSPTHLITLFGWSSYPWSYHKTQEISVAPRKGLDLRSEAMRTKRHYFKTLMKKKIKIFRYIWKRCSNTGSYLWQIAKSGIICSSWNSQTKSNLWVITTRFIWKHSRRICYSFHSRHSSCNAMVLLTLCSLIFSMVISLRDTCFDKHCSLFATSFREGWLGRSASE